MKRYKPKIPKTTYLRGLEERIELLTDAQRGSEAFLAYLELQRDQKTIIDAQNRVQRFENPNEGQNLKVKIEKHNWTAEKGHLVTVSLSNQDWAKLMPTFDAASGYLEISVAGIKGEEAEK